MVTTRSHSQATLARDGYADPAPDVPPRRDDDVRPPRLPKARSYWIAMIFPIGLVWAITPLLCFKSLRHIYHYRQLAPLASQSRFAKLLLWAAHAEVLFTLYYQYLAWRVQRRKSYPVRDYDYLRTLLMQCLSIGVPADYEGDRRPKVTEEPDWNRVEDGEELSSLRTKLRAWFDFAPISEIRADNVREWLAWAVANGQTLEEAKLDPKGAALVEEGLRMVQQRIRWTFPEGYNPTAKPLRLTLDRVPVQSRPLGYYCVINAAIFCTYAWLVVVHGFRFRSAYGLQMLVKAPTPNVEPSPGHHHFTLPVILLHGLGVGLPMNAAFLRQVAHSTKGVVLLLQPEISTQIWHPRFLDPVPKDDYVKAVKETCDSLGIKKASIVSQSNGTMVAGWLLRGCPELCERNVLVDAVSFLLWQGDVAYAFLRKQRHTALHALLSYFVLREVGIAVSITRSFQWTDMLLWEHELPSVDPEHFRVILGENDILVDTAMVVRYLRDCGVPEKSIKVLPGGQHGASLIGASKTGMAEVLSML